MIPPEPATTVVNSRHSTFDVYIGRGSKWGNPFSHNPRSRARFITATREEAISKYEEWIKTQEYLLSHLWELRGKILGCYCKPKACHGDVLARLANEASSSPSACALEGP